MQFSSAVVLSAVAGSALAAYSNSTVTDIQTTVVTITSCEENKCHETEVTTGVTTVTEVDTTYTTYCPLSTTEAPAPSTATDVSTTVVTITSCEEDKCHETAVTTGVTTVTEGTTIYTTYCPLPSTEAPGPAPSTAEESKPAESSPVQPPLLNLPQLKLLLLNLPSSRNHSKDRCC